MSDTFIKLKNVDLKYPLFNFYELSFRKKILSLFKKNETEKTLHALKNINLEINEGDRVALLGPNGSGKTTLLKVLSEIYEPTKGQMEKKGKQLPLLELNMGTDKDATGIENIYLQSYSRGISKIEIEKNMDWIINFSGLKERIHMPVRTYSSGMVVRLASSIVLSQKPDIFLSDEFFGAGDQSFKEKVSNHIKSMIYKSNIFILATHDLETVKLFCNRIINLENGKIISDRRV